MPETSIIIRTFNEVLFLRDLLEGIGAQTYQDYQIIVVDSGSFDGTVDIAREFGVQLVEISGRDFTFGFSLNKGIEVSNGRFIVLVSAHTTPVDTEWLGTLVEPLRDPNVAMTYGRQVGEARSKFSERQDLRRTFGDQRQVIRPPNFFANNANSAAQRDLWNQHRFDEGLPGLEDAAWAKHWMDLGYQVVYEPAAGVHHIHTETWPQVEHRYFREALAAHAIGVRGRSHVLSEIASEAWRFLADVGLALFKERSPRLLLEIARFRWAKGRGTARGLFDHSEAQIVADHQGFFFKDDVTAVVVTGPGRASYKMVTLPEMKPGDVVVQVEYVGVCGTDLEVFRGTLGYFKSGESAYPITPGHEVSGTVVRTGRNARTTVQVGDRVVIECIQGCGACETCELGEPIRCGERKELGVMGLNGGYAKHIVVAGAHVHRIPDGLDLQRAALCEPLAVAMKGRRRLMSVLGPGRHHIGVLGAGSLGQLLALVLAREGHRVSLVDRRKSRLEAATRALPESEVSTDPASLWKCDAVAEVTGHSEVLEALLGGVGVGRTVLLLGFPYGRLDLNPERVVAQDLSLLGSVGSGPADFQEALELLPSLPLDEFLTSTFPLESYEDAWAAQEKGEVLKVMLDVSGESEVR
jgi:2-desacetyl-2-hydroxyethyl bacteriochlorophyllide A dehydrogenase